MLSIYRFFHVVFVEKHKMKFRHSINDDLSRRKIKKNKKLSKHKNEYRNNVKNMGENKNGEQ